MSRRKQSNPKPIKLEKEEEGDEELEEEVVERNHSIVEGESVDVDAEQEENENITASSQKVESSAQENNSNEESTSYECPVCLKGLDSQHDFTVHIRMHNSEEHTTTHTCSLCSKTLSSASSLDRHMLVHSGERPFKCSRCNMAFTTNGNMHRHMRTHHGESSSSANRNAEDESRVRTPTKRAAAASPWLNDEYAAKRALGDESDQPMTNGEVKREMREDETDEQLHCPVCNKGFLCKYGLQTHLETHPDYVFKCHECNLTFRNYRGLNRHQYVAHIKRNNTNKDSAVDQNRKTTLVGFQDLTFLDFSSTKFAVVATAFCEKNARRPSSAFHIFECPQCKKAFPCGSALKMHLKSHANNHTNHHRPCEGVECLQVPFADKENFLAVLGLRANRTTIKDERYTEEPYENPSYFTHGMPISAKNRSIAESYSNSTSDGEDFADIQSILSLTTSPALLSNMNGNVNSISAPRRGLAVNPESPATADSATASPKMPSDVSEQAATSTPQSTNSLHQGRYPCKLCPLVFPNLRALKGHNRSHLGMSPYRCNMCSYTSIDKSTLLRHLRTHNGERPFLCRLCQYAFTTKANCERHMRKRHGKQNKQEIRSSMEQKPQLPDPEHTLNSFHCPDTVCKYCNVDFKFYRILRHHLRSLHSSCARKPFQCRRCHMGFSTKNNCYRHVQKQHTEDKDNIDDSIWCCYTDTIVSPGKETGGGHEDEDYGDDERSGNENDGTRSPALSGSPGPPLLDPMVPIADTSLSDMEMSSVEALVSWSTRSLAEVPLQEEPLDLAVRPVDLTLNKSSDSLPPSLPKINQSFTITNSASTNHSPKSSTPYSHLPPPPTIRVQSSPFVCRSLCNSFSQNPILSVPELSPGSTVSSSPSSLCSVDNGRLSKSSCSSPVATNLTKPLSLSVGTLVKKQKQKRYRTERPFKCDHCDAGFTLRSNMERHIKQQHPDQWMVRSRGRKPSLSSSSANSRPLLPRTGQESSLLRPISNQVKEAISQQIRQRLAINAANSGEEKNSNSAAAQIKKESSNEVQEHAQDLVSVSRLLDTATAQNIQEIFRQAETNKETNQRRNEDGKGEVKRSAYTNAPHRVSCPFCARRFPWTSSLRRHILTHTGQKPFKCQYCPLLFTTKSNCDRHLVRKHGGVAGDPDNRTAPERPYRCVLCPNSAFSTPSNLRKHMQQKHEQDDEKNWDDATEENGRMENDANESENGLRDDFDDDNEDDEYDNDDQESVANLDEEKSDSKSESVDDEKTVKDDDIEDNVPSLNQESENEEENKELKMNC